MCCLDLFPCLFLLDLFRIDLGNSFPLSWDLPKVFVFDVFFLVISLSPFLPVDLNVEQGLFALNVGTLETLLGLVFPLVSIGTPVG